MTFLRATGFEMADHIDYWTGTSNLSINAAPPVGMSGNRCANIAGSSGNGPTWALGAAEEDDGITWGGRIFALAASGASVKFFGDGGTVLHVEVRWNPTFRRIEFYRGGTLIANTDPQVYDFNVADYWQVQVKIAAAGGTVAVRKNSSTAALLSFAGDTRNGGVDALVDLFQIGQSAGVGNYQADDFYLLNEQGPTVGTTDNTFQGDSRIYPLTSSAAGFYTNLVATGSVNNWENVDKLHTLDDASFNGDSVVADEDTYVFQDVPVATGSVRLVLLHLRAGKSDAGVLSGRRLYRRAAVDHVGADLVLPAGSFGNFFELFILDPQAGPGVWTIANINAAEFGFEVRA